MVKAIQSCNVTFDLQFRELSKAKDERKKLPKIEPFDGSRLSLRASLRPLSAIIARRWRFVVDPVSLPQLQFEFSKFGSPSSGLICFYAKRVAKNRLLKPSRYSRGIS
jgi:hypothetical protein